MTGMACCSAVKTGEYTIARVGKEIDGQYNMYFTKGQADKPPQWYEDAAGLPGHPSVLYNPDLPVNRILEVVTAQHVAVTPGNWLQELEEFAKIAGFKVLN
jgi:L-fucose isomerase-like protein